jgi:uncharacterized protein DUF6263
MKFQTSLFFLLASFTACNDTSDKKAEPEPPQMDSISVTAPVQADKAMFDTVATIKVPDSIRLRFNLQKGKTYDYTMVFDIEQSREARTMTNKMRWMYSMQVLNDAPIKTVRTTYRQIDMEMNMGGQKMEFSSEKAASATNDLMQMPSRIFGAIKGKSFLMKVNPQGEIASVSGFDTIVVAMVDEMKLPEQSKAGMLQNVKNQFNDEAVKQMFSQAFDIFPKTAVKIGDSWEKETTSLDPSHVKIKTVYTLKQIKGNRVTITGKSPSQTSTLQVNARTGLMMDGIYHQVGDASRNLKATARITGREL